MSVVDCRHFNGYKPCGLSSDCSEACPRKDVVTTRLLLVHLGALGAVVRSTALLKSMRRKFPRAHLTWVTDAPADQILRGHPLIDRVLTTKEADLLALSALEFDAAFVIDKSLKASGVLARTKTEMLFGFAADPRTGSILPATDAAEELWQIGLDDARKFFGNTKSEIRLVAEALELNDWNRDPYCLPLNSREASLRDERRRLWSQGSPLIGINTGCSDVIAAKKLTVEKQRELIRLLQREIPQARIVLLGGPEDEVRNQRISYGLPVISSPTKSGLRDGLVSVAACDVVITGDSLGMHMAISQGVWTVAWFGPTCAHEIELYDRGVSILSSAPCGPCWKRNCQKELMCYDQVSLAEIVAATAKGLAPCQVTDLLSSSTKPHSSGISS